MEVDASLINVFWEETCLEMFLKCSRITRYHRDVIEQNGKEMELFVGSAKNLNIFVPN